MNDKRDLRRRLDPRRDEVSDEILKHEAGLARFAIEQRLKQSQPKRFGNPFKSKRKRKGKRR